MPDFRRIALTASIAASLAVAAGCGDDAGKAKAPCVAPSGPGVVWASCSLAGADLTEANLSNAVISQVDLSNADLTGADLTGATIEKVEFEGAKLAGADFTRATISGGTIQKGVFCNTTMPDGKIASADC